MAMAMFSLPGSVSLDRRGAARRSCISSNSSIQPQDRFEYASEPGRRRLNRDGKDEGWDGMGRRAGDVGFLHDSKGSGALYVFVFLFLCL